MPQEAFTDYLKRIGQIKQLTHAQEIDLALRIKAGDEAAALMLFEANLRLVVMVAKRYIASSAMDIEDLVQEGNCGLMVAVRKYNPYRQFTKTGRTLRFSTCAVWWIRQALSRAVAQYGKYTNYPPGRAGKVAKAQRLLRACNLDDPADVAEVARQSGHTIDEIKNLVRTNFVCSIDAVTAEGIAYADMLVAREVTHDDGAVSPTMRAALACLDTMTRQIVILSFGLLGARELSANDIARALRISVKETVTRRDDGLVTLRRALSGADTITLGA